MSRGLGDVYKRQMLELARERLHVDVKKNYEEMLSGGCLKEVPGVKGNDE